jgi:hypothetical protein
MSDSPPDQSAPAGGGNDPAAEQIERVAAAFDAYATNQKSTEAKHAKHNRKIRWWTRIAAVSAIGYTLITLVILVATIRSIQESHRAVGAANRAADAASRQGGIAEDTEKRQLRAYVFVAAATPHDFVVSRTPYVDVRVRNFGQTPAYEATMDLAIRLKQLVDPGSFTDPGHPSPPAPIAPGVDVHPLPRTEEPLSNLIISDIRANRVAYFIFGIIRYKDAFQKAHWTRVRWIIGATELADGSVSIYREGNDADQDS